MKTSNQQIQIDFGKRVRAIRKQRGLSQEKFAFECNLDRTYISQVEQGRRNISLQNIKAIADALHVPIAEIFEQDALPEPTVATPTYRANLGFAINPGFPLSAKEVTEAAIVTAQQLRLLPFSLYHSVDLKTLSSIVGAIFAEQLANQVGAIVNPIEKGHPDIVPANAREASETQLRNYPQGLEIKVTVGNIKQGIVLESGMPRIAHLTGITWQAHHQEVGKLLGLVIDFAGESHNHKNYPIITGAFYTENLNHADWGAISGTTGRNTKVTGMKSSGKSKMGEGWILILERNEYINRYAELLNFKMG